jgi:hypothetical protein
VGEIPKRLRRLLREYASAAHEEELRRALLPLADAFRRWEQGALSSGELSELIHQYHQGAARELYRRHSTTHLVAPVAYAVAAGILDRTALPGDLPEYLAGMIAFYEQELARS